MGERKRAPASSLPRISLRSPPAQNAASPVPVSTMTRTSSSSSASSTASTMATISDRDKALRRSGRFNLSSRTWLSVDTTSSASSAAGAWLIVFPPA